MFTLSGVNQPVSGSGEGNLCGCQWVQGRARNHLVPTVLLGSNCSREPIPEGPMSLPQNIKDTPAV